MLSKFLKLGGWCLLGVMEKLELSASLAWPGLTQEYKSLVEELF